MRKASDAGARNVFASNWLFFADTSTTGVPAGMEIAGVVEEIPKVGLNIIRYRMARRPTAPIAAIQFGRGLRRISSNCWPVTAWDPPSMAWATNRIRAAYGVAPAYMATGTTR